MKRRRFVHTLLATPIAVAPAAGLAQQDKPQPQAPPKPNTPARQVPRQVRSVLKLPLVEVDATAQTAPHFFSEVQYATLEKLAAVLVPPIKEHPGATDAKAPAFLDFLLSVSPGDRQKLYQSGLDTLNTKAQTKYAKPFSALDQSQADAILGPLMTVRPWPRDLPEDPEKNFVAQVHEDLQTATMNSREWAASAGSEHRFTRGFRGSGMYWAPIDPISEG